jgi:CheY-like chemotaxis protein
MSKRIMVIDDDNAMRELFESFLADEGWEVFCYDYAHTHIEVVQHLAPDLIVLDLNQVQKGEGWSFLQLLKMEDSTAAIPVVICTTTLNLSLEIETYLATRHINIVHKPFDIDHFILTIQKNLIPHADLPILVVEGNEDLADTIGTILRLEGHLVTIASNSLLAFNVISDVQYALILVDISMPVMNGLEFITAYARQPGPHSSVILFSAQGDLLTEYLPSFVIDVLPNPFEISRLVKLISKYALITWEQVTANV